MLDELNETVVVDITSVTNGTENGVQSVTTTITDDDVAPLVTLSRNSASIVEAGGTVVFSAILSAASGLPVTVNLGFTGTAIVTSDYARTGTQIVIAPGLKSGSVTVNAIQDAIDEPSETILVDILGVTNGSESGTQQSTSLIVDDDAPPTVTLSSSNQTIAEAAGFSVFTATLSAVSGQAVTINLGFGGTATLTNDYTRTGTQIIILAGSETGTITVTAVQDLLDELDETVIVEITSVIAGKEDGVQSATTTIGDDDV